MKRSLCCILIVMFFFNYTLAQKNGIDKLFRSQDNNHALKTDSTDCKIHRVIKEIGLSRKNENINLSFGGEIRMQYRINDAVNFGDVRPTRDIKESYLFLPSFRPPSPNYN